MTIAALDTNPPFSEQPPSPSPIPEVDSVFGAHARSPSVTTHNSLHMQSNEAGYDTMSDATGISQPYHPDEVVDEPFDSFADPEEDEVLSEVLLGVKDFCSGMHSEWTAGLVRKSYPGDLHDDDQVPWDMTGWHTTEDGREIIHLRSKQCTGVLKTAKELAEGVCRRCAQVPSLAKFRKVEERAAQPALSENMPWKYLTHEQLLHVARTVRKHNRILRAQVSIVHLSDRLLYLHCLLKNQSLQKQLDRAKRRLSDEQRVITFLSEYNVPGLQRLLAIQLRRGSSPRRLLKKLQACVDGLYTPRGNFSRREYDIAFIAKALGGPRLLYALQKAFALPSNATLYNNAHVPELQACVGAPMEREMEANIDSVFNELVRAAPPTKSLWEAGMGVQMDGISTEEVCRHDSHRNAVLGLCREHASAVDTTVTDYDSIKAIESALDGGKVHVGKDATVLALGSIADPDHSIPIPVLVSASCKKEDGDGLAHWIELFLDVWKRHPCGEARHGPITVLASDGESTFRSARFKLAMKERIDTTEGYGIFLEGLDGLNLQTGIHGLLTTCDYKHVFKRE